MARIVQISALLALAATGIWGQSPLAFEVASIKPAPTPTPELRRAGLIHSGVKIDNARADFGGISLFALMTRAYRVRYYQINGPDWMSKTLFDILAKLPAGSSADQVPEMLQTLLVERFKLTLHRDTKESAVYALVVGKDGPKLTAKPADYDPAAKNTLRPMTLDDFAAMLSTALDKPVVDKTELPGEYMLSSAAILQAVIQEARMRALANAGGIGGAPADGAAAPPGANAFSIVQTLGLKLEPRKLPLPMLTVDHIEKAPTENYAQPLPPVADRCGNYCPPLFIFWAIRNANSSAWS